MGAQLLSATERRAQHVAWRKDVAQLRIAAARASWFSLGSWALSAMWCETWSAMFRFERSSDFNGSDWVSTAMVMWATPRRESADRQASSSTFSTWAGLMIRLL